MSYIHCICRAVYENVTTLMNGVSRAIQAYLMRLRAATTVLIFVDNYVSIPDLLRVIEDEVKRNKVICVCVNYATEVKIREVVNKNPILSRRVAVKEVIAADADPNGCGYIYAREVASCISRLLCTRFAEGARGACHAEILESFKDYLADYMQRAIRPALIFMQLVQNGAAYRATILYSGLSSMRHFAESLVSDARVTIPITLKYAAASAIRESGKTKQQEVVERFAASCRGRNDKRNVLMLPKQYCDVLVLTSMRGYIYRKSMMPVIRELSKNLSVLVLNGPTRPAERSELAKEIQCIGVDFDFFAPENRPPPSDEALKILQECAKELLTYFRDNLRSCPLILAEHALLTYASLIPRMYGYAEAVWEVADSYCRTGFGCLIVSPGRTFESRLFVRRARAWGIRSIDLQVGTLSSAPKFLPPIADRVLAQDPVGLNLFRNHFQIEDSRIVLVGAPKSDDLISSFGSLSKEDARKKLGLSTDVDGGPIILFTSQPFSEALMGAIFRLVCDAGARTILKLHPAETPQREEFYRSIVDEIGASERVSIVRDGNTFEYIRAVDVVATYCSGTGIEAFQLDRPVLMVNPFDEPPPFDLYSLGVAYRVRTAGEIADLSHAELEKPGSIAALFDDPVILEQRELMRSIADGKAVDRILREVNLAQAETRLTKHMDNTTVLIETEWRRH